jgi:hypothetical protein
MYMKNSLLLSLSLLGLASFASATPILCGSFNYTGGTGTSGSSLNCAAGLAQAAPGSYINSITITVTSDYTGYLSGGSAGQVGGSPIETITYTFGASGGFSYSNFSQGVTTTCGVADPSTGIFTCNSNAQTNPQTSVNGNQSITSSPLIVLGGSAALTGGTVVSGSSVVLLNYTTALIGSTPEPTTLGLVGCSLLGLGFLARRKK